MQNLTTFKAGNVYQMNWIGDSDLKTLYKVVKRTAKFVTLERVGTSETVRAGVKIYNGVEYCFPTGNYSMAPSLYADKPAKEEKAEPKKEATRIEYKGYVIVDSNRLSGWFMTECGHICGESISEVKYDIDGTARAQEWEESINARIYAPVLRVVR